MHDFSRAAVHEGRYVINELRGMEKESEEQKGEEEGGETFWKRSSWEW